MSFLDALEICAIIKMRKEFVHFFSFLLFFFEFFFCKILGKKWKKWVHFFLAMRKKKSPKKESLLEHQKG